LLLTTVAFAAEVVRDGKSIYIKDLTGERWEVTQAVSLGFKPGDFQYGIGKYAFTPLDDSHLDEDNDGVSNRLRIIGIQSESQAQAYAISKLARHEIANTTIDSKPIAAGY
jgi:hypothetical protein